MAKLEPLQQSEIRTPQMRGWFRTCPALRESEIGDLSKAKVTLGAALKR